MTTPGLISSFSPRSLHSCHVGSLFLLLHGLVVLSGSSALPDPPIGRSRDALYEPELAENEREAVRDLLQFLENVRRYSTPDRIV